MTPRSRGADSVRGCINICPSEIRGRRESRVPNAPAASRAKVESTRVSHYRFTGNAPAFPAQWFTAYSVLSPVTGSFATVACASYRRLDASVGTSGPHDFAVRFRQRPSCVAKASTASRPALMTLRNAPLIGTGWLEGTTISDFRKEIFLGQDRAPQISLNPLKKLAFRRRRFGAVEGRTREMNRCELIKLICPGANHRRCCAIAGCGRRRPLEETQRSPPKDEQSLQGVSDRHF